jgi:hypothetical protein
VILYYESDLEAYRTDTFTNWVGTPEPNGYFVFGYVPYGYMEVTPVIGENGERVTSGSRTIPLWVWGAGVAVLLVVAIGIGAVRRRGEDERV